jgi:RimJ/RimL family protein N-acetyltransferase
MEPLPLGLRTDLLVAPKGLVTRRLDDLLALRTLDYSHYYFGNLLFLPASPRAADLPALLDRWRDFAAGPGEPLEKVVFQWETPLAAPPEDPALESTAATYGLVPDRNLVLRLGTPTHQPARVPMHARPVASEADWAAAVEVAATPDSSPGRLAFDAWRRREHRRLVEAGRGMWWLAEADGRAVSSAGIFWDAQGKLARFQSVDTRPEARGNGFCTGLLNAMVRDIQQRLPQLETCVIVAEVGAQAERIYRRVGFEPASRQDALWGDRPPAN